MGVICKYKYDSSIYADLIPEFNSGYSGYTITDEVEGNIITRTIENDSLPTLMRFGVAWVDNDTDVANFDRCNSLLEILDMNTSEITAMSSMFRRCRKLTSIKCNWNTNKVANIYSIFEGCNSLISVDISNLCTNQTLINMFRECSSLTELNLSNWDTSIVTNVNGFVRDCSNLTKLDLSSWNTSKITDMGYMFYNCNKLTLLDISNFDMSKVTNTTSMFDNTSSLTDISMLNCDINTINKVGTLTNATLWVGEHINIADYNGIAPIKTYREDKLEIKLNSPLLEGDAIEVVGGKLCHVHRMDMYTFDGSEDELWRKRDYDFLSGRGVIKCGERANVYCLCSKYKTLSYNSLQNGTDYGINVTYYLRINTKECDASKGVTLEEFKQWLSENPVTIVYELASPYYEDITPLQSLIVLKTFLESSMTIDTNLPIKTNVSYRTNVPSISALSTRATELAESDNVIHNLMNIIDDEVDE